MRCRGHAGGSDRRASSRESSFRLVGSGNGMQRLLPLATLRPSWVPPAGSGAGRCSQHLPAGLASRSTGSRPPRWLPTAAVQAGNGPVQSASLVHRGLDGRPLRRSSHTAGPALSPYSGVPLLPYGRKRRPQRLSLVSAWSRISTHPVAAAPRSPGLPPEATQSQRPCPFGPDRSCLAEWYGTVRGFSGPVSASQPHPDRAIPRLRSDRAAQAPDSCADHSSQGRTCDHIERRAIMKSAKDTLRFFYNTY